MGLLSRLLRKKRPAPARHYGPAEEQQAKQPVNREDLTPLSTDPAAPRREDPQPGPGVPGTSALAEAALRDALNAVQAVAEKARNYVAEIGQAQERASATTRRESAPAQAPAAHAGGALMTEASAAVLTEYLKHFFDLVSMQNRLLERRLDSLEQLISRLDKHVTEDAAEVSARLTTLEGVQLPLVKGAEETVGRQPQPAPDRTATAGTPPEAAMPKEAQTAPAGQPVQGVLRLKGLPSFRSLFAIRDELRRRQDVLGAEAASFEAGAAELRIKATRIIDSGEICGALREATGLEFAPRGPMSFEVVAHQRRTA